MGIIKVAYGDSFALKEEDKREVLEKWDDGSDGDDILR